MPTESVPLTYNSLAGTVSHVHTPARESGEVFCFFFNWAYSHPVKSIGVQIVRVKGRMDIEEASSCVCHGFQRQPSFCYRTLSPESQQTGKRYRPWRWMANPESQPWTNCFIILCLIFLIYQFWGGSNTQFAILS